MATRRLGAWWSRASALARPFAQGTNHRLLLVSEHARIPQSQIHPFHHFSGDLHRLYDVSVREVPLEQVLAGRQPRSGGATVVAFQTPFDIPQSDLERLLCRLRADHPGARLVCLDWFAPTDLRNAARVDPWVDVYLKKHVLRRREMYGQPTLGDTNLTDHYARRFGLPEPERRHEIPPGFLEKKLVIGPSFVTSPAILPDFLRPLDLHATRPIDLHARFAVTGTGWYAGMRQEAEAALAPLSDLALARGNNVPMYRFMAEMRRAKVCFSPFGYGEVCWRDYEAVAAGAVLLKPDMGHVETAPDIFRPWETYVPLRWDLSDFEAILRRLLADDDLRRTIAARAFATLRDYATSDAFARQMAPIFD